MGFGINFLIGKYMLSSIDLKFAFYCNKPITHGTCVNTDLDYYVLREDSSKKKETNAHVVECSLLIIIICSKKKNEK